jgi:hypothetical protein
MKSVSLLRASLVGAVAMAISMGFAFCVSSVARADCVLVDGGSCFYKFTDAGGSGAAVPFGSIEVTEAANGSSLSFLVNVSPNFSITAGNAHEAFSFAIGSTAGTLANLGHIDAASIVQNGGTSTLGVDPNNGTSFKNAPFSNFNYALDCSSNGGSSNCGQSFSFTFDFATANTGKLIPSTSDASIWFAGDVCVPNTNGGCSSTGAAGASVASVSVPGPIVGAGLPGLIAACGGLLALARRRQRKTA